MNDSNANSSANIDQSINLPDFFGCGNCVVVKNARLIPFSELSGGGACRQMQEAGRCRAEALRLALQSGAVQIHLHVSGDRLLPG